MTVAESIAQAAASLPPEKQQEVLDFVEFISRKQPSRLGNKPPKFVRAKPVKKRQTVATEVDAAIADAAGIWKNRTDLPKDSIAASRALRRRLMRRGGHA